MRLFNVTAWFGWISSEFSSVLSPTTIFWFRSGERLTVPSLHLSVANSLFRIPFVVYRGSDDRLSAFSLYLLILNGLFCLHVCLLCFPNGCQYRKLAETATNSDRSHCSTWCQERVFHPFYGVSPDATQMLDRRSPVCHSQLDNADDYGGNVLMSRLSGVH
jgi:hypothetical protein